MTDSRSASTCKKIGIRLTLVTITVCFLAAAFAAVALGQQAVDREAPYSKMPITKPGQPLVPTQLDARRPNAPEVASNYTFATATNASLTDMSVGTTTLVGANLDDTASAVNNIGFDFYFQGVRFSQFSANSNGLIRLGAVAVQGGSQSDARRGVVEHAVQLQLRWHRRPDLSGAAE